MYVCCFHQWNRKFLSWFQVSIPIFFRKNLLQNLLFRCSSRNINNGMRSVQQRQCERDTLRRWFWGVGQWTNELGAFIQQSVSRKQGAGVSIYGFVLNETKSDQECKSYRDPFPTKPSLNLPKKHPSSSKLSLNDSHNQWLPYRASLPTADRWPQFDLPESRDAEAVRP